VPKHVVDIGGVRIGAGQPLALISGPCALEDEGLALEVAREASAVASRFGIPYVFKSSYLKDNRMSAGSYAGPGVDEGLRILARVKEELGVPVLADVHERGEVAAAAEVLDCIQVPAFLCRQTRLLERVAATGLPINIKKGQFVAPDSMERIAGKAAAAGNDRILLTERGTTFGYHNLVVDMRGIEIMRRAGFPVVFDATHSVQLPGASSGVSGGQPEFVAVLSRAACGAGCDALFVETHPEPPKALSDAASMVSLDDLPSLLADVLPIARAFRAARPEVTGA